MYFPDKKSSKIFAVKQAEFNDIKYKINMVLVLTMEEDLLIFGKIHKLFTVDKEIILLVRAYRVVEFNEYIFAYKVVPVNKLSPVNIDTLPQIHPCLMINVENSEYIATKYIL